MLFVYSRKKTVTKKLKKKKNPTGSPPIYKKDGNWSSVYSSKNKEGYNFLQEREKLVKCRIMPVAEGE